MTTDTTQKTIDCEVRTLLTPQQYESLRDFFAANAEFRGEDTQETRYFAGEHDLRIQKTEHRAKIWLKEAGAFGDRGEIAINVAPSKFDDFAKLFATLGYETAIIWMRHRRTFLWEGISVSLDDTKGFGVVLELKKSCDAEWRLETMDVLRGRLEKIGLKPTPKPLLHERFQEYRANWKELLAAAAEAEKMKDAVRVTVSAAVAEPVAAAEPVVETAPAEQVEAVVEIVTEPVVAEAVEVAEVVEIVEVSPVEIEAVSEETVAVAEVPHELESVLAPAEETILENENAPA